MTGDVARQAHHQRSPSLHVVCLSGCAAHTARPHARQDSGKGLPGKT